MKKIAERTNNHLNKDTHNFCKATKTYIANNIIIFRKIYLT